MTSIVEPPDGRTGIAQTGGGEPRWRYWPGDRHLLKWLGLADALLIVLIAILAATHPTNRAEVLILEIFPAVIMLGVAYLYGRSIRLTVVWIPFRGPDGPGGPGPGGYGHMGKPPKKPGGWWILLVLSAVLVATVLIFGIWYWFAEPGHHLRVLDAGFASLDTLGTVASGPPLVCAPHAPSCVFPDSLRFVLAGQVLWDIYFISGAVPLGLSWFASRHWP